MTLKLPRPNVQINPGRLGPPRLTPKEQQALAQVSDPVLRKTLGEMFLAARGNQENFDELAQQFPIQPHNVADAVAGLPVENLGDLITADVAGAPTILPVGADGKVLFADSSTATGLRWGDALTGATSSGVAGPQLTANSGLFELTTIPKLILAIAVAWGPGNVSAMTLGGTSLSTTTFGNIWTLGSGGPGMTGFGMEPRGDFLPGKISYTVTKTKPNVPHTIFLFFFNPPGPVTRSGVVGAEGSTAKPATEERTFGEKVGLMYSILLRAGAKVANPTARNDQLLVNAQHVLTDEAGKETANNGFIEVVDLILPAAGKHKSTWEFAEALNSKTAINELIYT